ncbi:cyclin-T1-4-like isoform X1 [Actinidia eriantha]|uniref:cyclin-T1-4-like isoform X1 n=1 Tax=Actinidia eriantha TaxID=165200 RepID=UPI00258B278D|nr:cyclin-T1-4-like isoform X1 [Actinidia eriantha]XP_057513639.1 cyclin-T1-4-like isoform X1 [Actinidia eriantha]
MAGLLPGEVSHQGMYEVGPYKFSQEKAEDGGHWYFSRKEIEENSSSRLDGIDLKKETYLRKSYCTFLQDLGMRLKVPQVTIATAIIFCHRFFLCQSHAKNDRRTIATVCMFLAGKVEETPRPLKDVILVSYEIIHKKDPAAVQRIKQKEVYEQQKELILLGERIVLATLGFDLNVHHPYKPLVEAIKKFKVAQNALAQVAWNFVNDGLRTSLCLQFKPHHIAAGAIFLAAKFLKVKLPSDGEKVWWQEFDVTPRQLEEVSNQMLELYEQNRVPPSQTSEAEGSAGAGVSHRPPSRAPAGNEENATNSNNAQGGGTTSKPGGPLKPPSSWSVPDHSYADNHGGPSKTTQSRNNDYGSSEIKSVSDYKGDGEVVNQHHESEESLYQENLEQVQNRSRFGSEGHLEEDQERQAGRNETREAGELKDKDKYHHGYKDGTLGQSPQEAIKKIDKDKVKAALEKRRKSRGDVTRKTDLMDEDDLIERELEDGIELAAESEKTKQERRQSWSKSSNWPDHENTHHVKHQDDAEDGHHQRPKGQSGRDFENVEEGEVAGFDDAGHGYRSPKSDHKRKAGSPPDRSMEGKQRSDYVPGSHHHNHHEFPEDRNRLARLGYPERDQKRHVQENHV